MRHATAGAPVSKTWSIMTTLATFAVLSNKSQDMVSLVGYRVFGEANQWWRVFTSLHPLASLLELLLSLHAIRVFRVLERQMGSAKFGSFLFLAAALTKTAELALSVQFPYFRPPLGPLAVLSTCSTTYYGYIPARATTLFTIGEMRVTEKFFLYLTVLVVLVKSWVSTSINVWRADRVPIRTCFQMSVAFVPTSNQIAARRAQLIRLQQMDRVAAARQGDHIFARTAGTGFGTGTATGLRQRMEIPPPSEQDITLLMGLGFDRDTVVRVLRSSGNDTEAAANRLLGH
eukprot:jgi/Undpi1/2465/HiC_scaffold_13.g05845.m1